MIPPGGPQDYILEIEPTSEITPLLHKALGYGHVSGCAPDLDLERDFYPYPNAHFRTIVCLEVLDRLQRDPMYMMDEIHRILRPGCHLVLTTRRGTSAQIGELLEGCGLEVTRLETEEQLTYAAGRKVGPVRERYPRWLYPERP